MSQVRVDKVSDPCELTVAVGSTASGETFCSIVASTARIWPWQTGLKLVPASTAAFIFEADGPMFGRGATELAWVELIARDSPESLLWVSRPEPQQPSALTRLCTDDFVLTVNEDEDEGDTNSGECWVKLPADVTAAAVPTIVNERAELLVATHDMGRAWLYVSVTGERGQLRDAPPPSRWWPLGRTPR